MSMKKNPVTAAGAADLNLNKKIRLAIFALSSLIKLTLRTGFVRYPRRLVCHGKQFFYG
jgi:hypothetical protein